MIAHSTPSFSHRRRLPDKRGADKSMERTLRAAHDSTTPILASVIFLMPTRMMLRGVRNS